MKFSTKSYLNFNSRTSINQTKQVIREAKTIKSFCEFGIVFTGTFSFPFISTKQHSKSEIQLTLVFSNVLFLAVCKKNIFRENGVLEIQVSKIRQKSTT